MLLSADQPKSSPGFNINQSRQKHNLASSVLGDSCSPPPETHVKWET